MPFVSSCCCSRHDEWKHGAVDSNHLRQCTREEAEILDFASKRPEKQKSEEKNLHFLPLTTASGREV